MQLPPELLSVLQAARQIGRPRLAGGCVRDWLLNLQPVDFDVEVFGCDFETLARALAPFGATDLVGRSFGVIKLRLGESVYDFSLPRRESKIGAGHRGFAIAPDPSLTDAEAAARRDFTINSISYDPFTDALIDPHGGEDDLRARILRHTSDAFTEDPLRVLRGMQFAARFELSLAQETAAICRRIHGTYGELAVERVWGEWDKWATKSIAPSRGIGVLEATGWITHFPEIAALAELPQEPEWHPEGDVLRHTKFCLDALCRLNEYRESPTERRRYLTFAVLAHDFGKATTTRRAERHGRMRWVSPGHEAAGGTPTETFLQRIGAPHALIEWVRPLVKEHMVHHAGPKSEFGDAQVRRLSRRLTPTNINDLALVMMSDSLGRPPMYSHDTMALIEKLRTRSRALSVASREPHPLILGRHLLQLGLRPGPDFKPLLDACFEAQLDGAFLNEADAITWLKARILNKHGAMISPLSQTHQQNPPD